MESEKAKTQSEAEHCHKAAQYGAVEQKLRYYEKDMAKSIEKARSVIMIERGIVDYQVEKLSVVIIIITCDIYNIIIPDSDLFPPSTDLNSQESVQRILPLQVQSLIQTHSHHHVLSGSHFFMDK